MHKKIFVGGFGGCGSRVVQRLLELGDYNVGVPYVNEMYDYIGFNDTELKSNKKIARDWFVPSFDKYYFDKNKLPLIQVLNRVVSNTDSYSLKHGHLMFIMDELKEWFPGSENIYVMRNPIDNALNQYNTDTKYGNLNVPSYLTVNSRVKTKITEPQTLEKIQWHIDNTKIFMNKADYVVKLEDLCFNTEETISNLLKYANVEYDDIKPFCDIIETPPTIGRGKEYYDNFDLTELGY